MAAKRFGDEACKGSNIPFYARLLYGGEKGGAVLNADDEPAVAAGGEHRRQKLVDDKRRLIGLVCLSVKIEFVDNAGCYGLMMLA